MIEHVKGIKHKLSPKPLSDRETLRHRQIRVEPRRSMERVPADIAQIAKARIGERPPRICGYVWNRSEERAENAAVGADSQVAHSRVERARTLVRAADAYVLFGVAVVEFGRPRQSATPVGSVAQLPSTHQIVPSAADVSHIRLAFTERQLVDGVEQKRVVAAEIDRGP